jgi:hypothetical protein
MKNKDLSPIRIAFAISHFQWSSTDNDLWCTCHLFRLHHITIVSIHHPLDWAFVYFEIVNCSNAHFASFIISIIPWTQSHIWEYLKEQELGWGACELSTKTLKSDLIDIQLLSFVTVFGFCKDSLLSSIWKWYESQGFSDLWFREQSMRLQFNWKTN